MGFLKKAILVRDLGSADEEDLDEEFRRKFHTTWKLNKADRLDEFSC